MTNVDADVLVIGSGIAGLTFALRMAEAADVVLVTKKQRLESSTNYAQGGIAAVIDQRDSFERHIADTLRAGAGLCHRERVEMLVRSGPRAVADLIDWGVRFTRGEGGLSLGIEGGHSHPRIVHSKDHTGLAIESALLEAVAQHSGITLLEHHMALGLEVACADGERRCAGGWVLDAESARLMYVNAKATLVATGGSASVYRHSTNPAIATGDGVAMAYRAGAAIANMEFIQFHPTALYPAEEHAFLISEAVRGEGAVLRNHAGVAFMPAYDARRDLAPRDIVARAVQSEMKKSGEAHVWLDATGMGRQRLEERFPQIVAECVSRGIDPETQPIPVVPAAHYVCGGVWTDMDGHTTVPSLFAVGECACTGVHGANRLASNSLLEAVVFAERAAARMREQLRRERRKSADASPPEDLSGFPADGLAGLRQRLKRLMWLRLGIVRGLAEMEAASDEIVSLREEWEALRRGRSPSGSATPWVEAAEVLNMLDVAGLVARCALARRESRGLHYVVDFPHKDSETFLRDTFVKSRA